MSISIYSCDKDSGYREGTLSTELDTNYITNILLKHLIPSHFESSIKIEVTALTTMGTLLLIDQYITAWKLLIQIYIIYSNILSTDY